MEVESILNMKASRSKQKKFPFGSLLTATGFFYCKDIFFLRKALTKKKLVVVLKNVLLQLVLQFNEKKGNQKMQKEAGLKKPGESHHHKYIVTQSLRMHLLALERIGLKVPNGQAIEKAESKLIIDLEENFSGTGVKIEAIAFETLCNQILSLAHEIGGSFADSVIVSTAPMIALESGGECIEMNRLINMDGEIIGIGPRPGHPSVEKQINEQAVKLSGKNVIIVEDGSFTGRSLKYLLDLMLERSINVKAVVLGILFPKAEPVIREAFAGEIVCHEDASDVLDWMPSHDFFPFVPNSGRVVGMTLANTHLPIYLQGRMSISMPYIMPYGDPEWASLQGDVAELGRFSGNRLASIADIFYGIENANGKQIMIGDLLDSYPKTSLPVSAKQQGFLGLGERVVDVLHGDLVFLS